MYDKNLITFGLGCRTIFVKEIDDKSCNDK